MFRVAAAVVIVIVADELCFASSGDRLLFCIQHARVFSFFGFFFPATF